MSAKILVVEDNPDMTVFLKTFLEDNGYAVCAAEGGNEGLRLAKKEKPDLITLDLLMPDKTGIKLYRELRTDDDLKEIPIVVITGFVSPDFPQIDIKKFFYEERALPGPEAFFEKPVNKEELLAAIKRFVG